MSREYTEKEVREKVLKQIAVMVNYWLNESRTPDTKEKLEGLAFSICSMLDGCNLDIPGFIVAPLGHEEDIQYYKDKGENYYPVNRESDVKCDIGGCLHELIGRYFTK